MKKRLFILVCFIALILSFVSDSVFALNLSTASNVPFALSGSTYSINYASGTQAINVSSDYPHNAYINLPVNSILTDVLLKTSTNIPRNSIVSMNVTFSLIGNAYNQKFRFYGFNMDGRRSLLSQDCFNANGERFSLNDASDFTLTNFTCHLVYFNNTATSDIDFESFVPIIELTNTGAESYLMEIKFTSPSYIVLESNALTEDDRDFLESQLSTVDNTAVVQKLELILQEQQDTTSAIEDNTSAIEDNTDAVNEINDYLQDDTAPSVNTAQALANPAGWLPAGPVDSILTLPITFIQGIINALTGSDSCQPVVVPLPFLQNQNLILPCMRNSLNQMGFLTIYEVVGGIVAMFIIWDTLKWLYEFVDKTLSFREDNSGLWGGL